MYSGAFFRDARICPDGTCALALADDRSLSLFALPNSNENSSTVRSPLSQVWNHEPSDSLLSYDWYPGASSTDPSMFAFAVGVKDHPVHLLDGHDQRIRASYPIIDHTERFVAPNSMRFSPDGTSLYCGFDNAIEILDVSRPGEAGFRLKTTPNRTSRTGQKGLISALDFSPSEGAMLLAAGSFSGTIGLYDPSSSTPLSGILRSTHRGGVTQVKFHPTMPHLLFVASRQADYLEMFDLRNLALDPIRLERKGRTNQRIGFDIDPTGEWLMTGDQNGTLSFFDTSFLAYTDTSTPLAPTFTHSIRSEPIGAAMFHPDFSRTRQILTCTGTRTFDTRESSKRRHARHDDDCSNDSDGSSDSQDDQDEAGVTNVDVEVDSLQLFAW
ncbi:WD40 repeat domain-containing protein [Sporobolomyces koalae]|uniref:WD40 repeat domain-containing protein n=1 Tax=Sporobolomyces koalae TaxID=500713 RepID=UPI003178605E